MKHGKLPLIFMAAALAMPTFAVADDELEFAEAYLFFELNDTDGDLGIHGKVDGGPWKKVRIEGPDDRKLLDIKVKSGLKRQGMTELFFESAEPCFPETCEEPDDVPLDPEVFFDRFPEGVYEWEGKTQDGLEIEGEVYLSQRIPAAPVVLSVGDAVAGDECWSKPTGSDVTIAWGAVTKTHMELGSDRNADLDMNSVLYYEFVAEIDDTEYKSTAVIPPAPGDADNSWTIPAEFIALATEGEVKFEIIVRIETGMHPDDDGEMVDSRPGNQSAVESCFLTVSD